MSLEAKLRGIQYAAKFSAPERVLTFSGTGTLRTWNEPESLTNTVSQTLSNLGWGVDSVNLLNQAQISGTSLLTPVFVAQQLGATWNYYIKIGIESPLTESNPERVRLALHNVLGTWFKDLNLKLTGDTLSNVNPNTGLITTTDSNNPNLNTSILDKLFGRGTTIGDVTGTGAQFLGLGLGTIVTIGLGFILVNSIMNAPRRRSA